MLYWTDCIFIGLASAFCSVVIDDIDFYPTPLDPRKDISQNRKHDE